MFFFFLFSRYLSTKNMWSLWFWIMSPNMKPYETFEKLRNKLLFGWSWHLKFSKQWTSLECPMPSCIPVHHVCFGSKINQRKTPFLGYLSSKSKHLEFLFLQLIGWHTCLAIVWWFFHMPKNAGMFAVFSPWVWRCRSKQWTFRTVLKTLGFFWQVFFDFSSHLFGGQKFLVIKNPNRPGGSYAPLLGVFGGWKVGKFQHCEPGWTISPPEGPKKNEELSWEVLKTHFYSEGKYQLVQIWQRQSALFSVLKEVWAASFAFATSHPRSSHLSPP